MARLRCLCSGAARELLEQAVPADRLVRRDPAGNVPPGAGVDSASTYQNVAVTIDVLANDTPGSGPGPLRVITVGPPLVGAASTNNVGQIVYTPVSGFLGEDTFTYVVSDGLGTSVGTGESQSGLFRWPGSGFPSIKQRDC